MTDPDAATVTEAEQPPELAADESEPDGEHADGGRLEGLLLVQGYDTSIRQLEHRLAHLPEQTTLDECEAELVKLVANRDTLQVELDEISTVSRKIEGDISIFQERRNAEESRMYGGQINNPKELQALRADIDAVDRRISAAEDELLEVMERRETVQGEVDRLSVAVSDTEERQLALATARDEAAQGLLAEVGEARAARDQIVAGVDAELVARYEEARDRFGGLGVGLLEGGMCTSCRIELPRREVSNLQAGPPLGTCPECRRLLVVPA